jgi:hypothetical protein
LVQIAGGLNAGGPDSVNVTLTRRALDYTQPQSGGAMQAELLHAAEAAAAAGISKPTLLRWIKLGKITDAARRDRNGWRIFDRAEVARIKALAASTQPGVGSR